jgi:multisubunit Na+/H+ antiporter MnhC subunit
VTAPFPRRDSRTSEVSDMAIIGLLLFVAATTIGVETVVSTRGHDVAFEIFGEAFTAPLATVFLLGALVMTVAILGAFMVTGAFGRRRVHRVEARHRVRAEQTETRLSDVDRTNAELVAENDRLRAELAAERRAAATLGGVAVPPGVGNVAYGDQVSDAVRSETVSETGHYEPYPVETGAPRSVDLTEAEEKADVLGRFRRV